ncbi:MAG TPA: ribose 5-phosphate isomerase B [Clostridiaceae bacterium]|jgi:ribose 5-phosphate isomerase B|nr:ribose 5-phosphate isomerase B [Clostridiaceae bacterium]
MLISLGSDHAGFAMRSLIANHLRNKGFEVIEHGAVSETEPYSYVKAGLAVASDIQTHRVERGIVICGTGIGISIACNKKQGIRCALCVNEFMAKMARQHNDAQILALGARVLGTSLAISIVDAYLDGLFEGGRHQERIDEIAHQENPSTKS